MTIATQAREKNFVAQGAAATVPINFPFAKATDLIVVPVDADGAEGDPLTLNSHYAIGGDGRAKAGVLTEISLVPGSDYRIRRTTALGQSYNPKMGIAGNASAMENQLDDIAMAQIDARGDLIDTTTRALLVPNGQEAPGFDASGLLDGDILTYSSGRLQRLAREAFAGKFYAGGVGGVLTPASGTGADGALRSDMADAAPGKGAGLVGFSRPGTTGLTASAMLSQIPFTPYQYGAVGDGVADDTVPVNSMSVACRAAGGEILFPPGIFRVTDNLFFSDGIRHIEGKGGIIKFDHAAGQKSFILATSGGVSVKRCTVAGLVIDANGKSTLGIYCQNTQNCHILDNLIFNLLSATGNSYGVFIKSLWNGPVPASGNVIKGNIIEGQTDYLLHVDGMQGIVVSGDSEVLYGGYSGPDTEWKAAFTNAAPDYYFEDNVIEGNIIRGCRYGLQIVAARNNVIKGNTCTYNTRAISAQYHAESNVIQGNTLRDWQACAVEVAYSSTGNLIGGNICPSSLATSLTESALFAYVGAKNNRFDGNEVRITAVNGPAYMLYAAVHANGNAFTNNKVEGPVQRAYCAVESAWDTTQANTSHRAQGQSTGMNFVANALTDNVSFKGNEIVATSARPAFFLAQISDTGNWGASAVNMAHNRIRGSASKILELLEENSGSSANHVWKDNEHATSSTSGFTLPRGYAHFLVLDDPKLTYGGVYDPASIAAGGALTTTVTVAGAAIGDFVSVTFSLDLQGIALSAYVSATGTVTVVFQNLTGGAIDLGSGTLRVRVRKQ